MKQWEEFKKDISQAETSRELVEAKTFFYGKRVKAPNASNIYSLSHRFAFWKNYRNRVRLAETPEKLIEAANKFAEDFSSGDKWELKFSGGVLDTANLDICRRMSAFNVPESYGLKDYFSGEFHERTPEDWDETFKYELDTYVTEFYDECIQYLGSPEALDKIKNEYNSEFLDADKYNAFRAELGSDWDQYLTEQYEDWGQQYDNLQHGINEYTKDMIYVIKKLAPAKYEIIYNTSSEDVPFYLQVSGIEPTKENCAQFIPNDDIELRYNDFNCHGDNITISCGGDYESIIL